MPDALTRFVFEYAPVQGGIVQLVQVWRTAQSHPDYPPPLRRVLGDLLAAAALLTYQHQARRQPGTARGFSSHHG